MANITDGKCCEKCGAPLTGDDIGLSRKMINRLTTTYYCTACLAEKYGMTVEQCERFIERLKANGCTLFN